MKKFIFFLISIMLTTYCLAFAIQIIADYGLKSNSNSIFEDWDFILKSKINAELVINGSSRGCVSYNSKVIESVTKLKSHNLGFNAGGFNLQQEKFSIYLKYNKIPRVIIQNIDLAHFNVNNIVPNESQFIPFINNTNVNQFLRQYDNKYYYLEYIPLLKYNQNFKLLKNGILNSIYDATPQYLVVSGFTPMNIKFNLDKHNLNKLDSYVLTRADFYKNIFSKFNLIENYYDNILSKNNELILIYVWAPENKARLVDKYNTIYEPLKNKLRVLDSINNNIYFLDFSNDVISNSDAYFYDSFHLNESGAKQFSMKLSKKINSILKK